MRVTSWNVNSIRARLERVLEWTRRNEPDVLCLQETKVVDEEFPRGPFEELGYHVEVHGQKTYNGVALITRPASTDVVRGLGADPEHQRRLIGARIGDLRVLCVYVPNGESPESGKFAYKLSWLAELTSFLGRWASPTEPLLVVGDFNIAPEDRDVHDPDAWRGHVLFHPKEHEALGRLRAWGLEDLFRLHEQGGGFYSWWDYRNLSFPRNAGLRIDLVLGTEAAAARCRAVRIDREARKGQKPSDHAPVTAWIDEDPVRA